MSAERIPIDGRERVEPMSASTSETPAGDAVKRPAEREVTDRNGVTWRVTEVRVWDANGHGAKSLIAAHERGFRRLWNFPDDWFEIEEAALAELVNQPARKVRRGTS